MRFYVKAHFYKIHFNSFKRNMSNIYIFYQTPKSVFYFIKHYLAWQTLLSTTQDIYKHKTPH
jgi:hypothetical protein